MLITDHINFLGLNLLVGPNDETFGPRFFPVADAWDKELGAKVKDAAKQQGAHAASRASGVVPRPVVRDAGRDSHGAGGAAMPSACPACPTASSRAIAA